MSFDHWRKRLEIAQQHSTVAARRAAVAALKINFSQPGEADCGYYRKPITEKDPSGNGINIIKGWIPVSYFMHGDKLVGIIGAGDEARDMTDQEVGDEQLWSYVVSHPIPYEWYNAVVEHGDDWPDMIDSRVIHDRITDWTPPPDTGSRTIESTDNKPPEMLPHVEHATAIDNAIGAAKDLKVTTAEEAAVAAGAANVIRDRRLAAEKVAKAKVTPLQLVYEEERNKWLPLVKRAKDAEGVLRTAVSTFELAERKRIAAEQLAAFDKQREQDESNARAADRAIGAGEPEQPPVVEDVVIPHAPQPIRPTYGSYKPAAKPLKKFAVIENPATVLNHYKLYIEVVELIQKLATADIRAGLEVPGATFREGTE